ncbi:MAG: FHA domain-containing protein [Ruminiclostridium sp.]
MNIKRIFSLFCTLVLAAGLSAAAFAEETDCLLQATVVEDEMDLFVSGDIYLPEVSVKTANKNAQLIDKGTISEKNVRLRTTILVDSSTSVSVNMRESVIEFIKNMIRDIGDKEEIRIASFNSEVSVLQNFSSDRYDLDRAVEKIGFDGKQSALFDAIHSTIPALGMPEGQPCFYRTIVLTDGADSAAGGITMEELFMELKEVTYPIDVVCVSEKELKNPYKNLLALTRISGGRYFAFNAKTDINALQQDLSVDAYKWIRVKIPAELLDGSTRQVDISDGNTTISFDLKMTASDIIRETEEQPAEETGADNKEDERDEEEEEEKEEEDTAQEGGIDTVLLLIIGAGALLAAVIVTIIIIAVKSGKKKKAQKSDSYTAAGGGAKTDFSFAETEFIGGGDSSYTIKLVNADNPGQNWELTVSDTMTIGRGEKCTIFLDDMSVSREQCLIDAAGGGLFVTNTSKSNLTRLNNAPLMSRTQLHSDDELKMGRVRLRVEYIQIIGGDMSGSRPYPGYMDYDGDETQNIFK